MYNRFEETAFMSLDEYPGKDPEPQRCSTENKKRGAEDILTLSI